MSKINVTYIIVPESSVAEDLPVSGSSTGDECAGSSGDELISQDGSSSIQTEEISLEWIKHIPLFEYRKSNKTGCEEYSTIKGLLKVL